MKAVQIGKLEITDNYDEVPWDKVIPVLMAYAYSLLGSNHFTNRRDQLAYDFALEAITKYLENREKFDPTKNPDLINYLKFYVLRQLISNFKGSAGVRKRITLNAVKGPENETYDYSLDELVSKDNLIANHVDLNILLERINKKLEKKPELQEIFTLLYYRGLKRSEICQELEIALNEFDNRLRRLKRLLDTEEKLISKTKQ
ncbi:RNA polymerase sigma factor [Flagellimonas sp.]|uniref:RNA polymerase sigma factor n=1 Tax=Flagellimonas sp. TaxID=2058762 RepID=UPI003BAF7161